MGFEDTPHPYPNRVIRALLERAIELEDVKADETLAVIALIMRAYYSNGTRAYHLEEYAMTNAELAKWARCSPARVKKFRDGKLFREAFIVESGSRYNSLPRYTLRRGYVQSLVNEQLEVEGGSEVAGSMVAGSEVAGSLVATPGSLVATPGSEVARGWLCGSQGVATSEPILKDIGLEGLGGLREQHNLTYLTGGALAPRASDPSPQGGMLPRAEGEELFLKEVPPARDRQPTEHSGNTQVDDISTIQITERQFPDSGKVTVDLRHGTPLMRHVMAHLASQGEAAPAAQALGRIKQRLREIYLTGGVDLVRTYIERALANAKRPGEEWQASMCASQRLLWELKTANTAKATNTSQSRRLKGAY